MKFFSWVTFIYLFIYLSFLKKFIYLFIYFISWRPITLPYCSGFCHTLTWISHGFTCVPHPEPPPTSFPIPSLWVIPVYQPLALVSCILTFRIWIINVINTGLLYNDMGSSSGNGYSRLSNVGIISDGFHSNVWAKRRNWSLTVHGKAWNCICFMVGYIDAHQPITSFWAHV